MKKLLMATAAIISTLIVVSAFSGTVSAGVEPSPFKSTMGKLGSLDNNLAEIQRNLGKVLAVPPPEDQTPGWKGPTNQLEAISHHLGVMDNRLEEILEAQDPGRDLLELFAFLTDTMLYRANVVELEMLDFLRLHSNDIEKMPEVFVDAFYDVLSVIGGIQERIEEFINPPTTP